jgi:hypothetical protein
VLVQPALRLLAGCSGGAVFGSFCGGTGEVVCCAACETTLKRLAVTSQGIRARCDRQAAIMSDPIHSCAGCLDRCSSVILLTWNLSFLDSFRYLDQLGRVSKRGVEVDIHSTLPSSNHCLFDENTLARRPNYWAVLLREFISILAVGKRRAWTPFGRHLRSSAMGPREGLFGCLIDFAPHPAMNKRSRSSLENR